MRINDQRRDDKMMEKPQDKLTMADILRGIVNGARTEKAFDEAARYVLASAKKGWSK